VLVYADDVRVVNSLGDFQLLLQVSLVVCADQRTVHDFDRHLRQSQPSQR
jgi:hypothetical protein